MPPAAKKTGRPVALSVNLPAGQPLMRAFAEKRLMQELQQLQLVSPPARLPAGGGAWHCWLLTDRGMRLVELLARLLTS
jgi:hypothetical protein